MDTYATPVASTAIALPPSLANHAFLSREALRPCPGQTVLDGVEAVTAAHLLHQSVVEPTTAKDWLGWCPGWLLSQVSTHNRLWGRRIIDVNGQGWLKS